MSSPREVYYRLAPGIDTVRLADDDILFRSDALAIRVESESSAVLLTRVLPLLNGRRTLEELATELADISTDDLHHVLEGLVQAQVLRRTDYPQEPRSVLEGALEPFLAMLDAFGIPEPEAREELDRLRVAVIGLEGHGAHAASSLAACGVGNIILVDPYPCEPGNLALMPPLAPNAVGRPREEVLQSALQSQGRRTRVLTGGGPNLSPERIFTLAAECHMLAGCFDRGYSATNHWINRAGLEHGVPAIYAESRGHTARVGPLVLPDQTACYMCYRMRDIATAENFDEAMSYEEFLDRHKRPALHERGVLPMVSSYIGSLLALEILKYLLSLSQSSLAGQMLEFDALSFHAETHDVLQKPDCPICGVKKNKSDRPRPSLAGLRRDDSPPGHLLAVAPKLLSPRTGVVRSFQRVEKDVSEPTRPYVFQAEVSNHRFLEKETREHRICSGKGMTVDEARISALGEAVERYSAACWHEDEIVYARRNDLDGEALDPRQLVLYAPGQYQGVPYAAYHDENVMGWVPARSLVTGENVLVPALAVYMSYEVRYPQEYIFPTTSNGLAAGPTLVDAILAATFEVMERDAFMIMWLNRLPCQRIDPLTHPDQDILDLCEAYQRRGVEFRLYRVPTDHPCHVFAALGVQTEGAEGPAVVVGLGADLEGRRAARKAILEVAQVRPGLRRRMRHSHSRERLAELVEDPRLVAELEDHDLLYASRKTLGAFEFLMERPTARPGWEERAPRDPIDQLQRLVDHLGSEGEDLLYHNLTPPDMRAFGLHTARVILPGFQPIDFGWKERRLGGDRLYELPRRLGLTPTRTALGQLNSDPHPIS